MDSSTTIDALTVLTRATIGLVESGGLLVAALALAAALTVAFCMGRLVERAMTQLRTARLPPAD
jgi:hypothetical protein